MELFILNKLYALIERSQTTATVFVQRPGVTLVTITTATLTNSYVSIYIT